jgi:ferredoxin
MNNEVEIKFEPENRRGVVATGTYLFDAAKRLGVKIEAECGRKGICDTCICEIKSGGDLLSKITKLEMEHLSAARRKKGERLACQAKIEKSGEIVAMPTHKKVINQDEFDEFCKAFAELPLTEKAAKLLQLESIALSDTFSAILNFPYTIGEKVRDMMAEVGMKMEADEKTAKTPEEHKAETADEKPKATTSKKPPAKKPAAPRKRTATAKPKPPGESK